MKRINSPGKVIRFGDFEVDTGTGELRKQGLRIKLQGQPFQVLCILLARPGELVTRDELRSKLWPADTFVDFEHGLNKAISKLREALGDNRENPRYIETLPRRGYRFIAAVIGATGPASLPGEAQETPVTHPDRVETGSPRQGRLWTTFVILFLLVLALLASSLLYHMARKRFSRAGTAVSAAPVHSLAVLPLQNLSGDKDQEYFADGMTDELITDLGQMNAFRVISRTSAMHYKGTSLKLPEIGRELGADVIVEGTVFRSGNRVRITAQLIDARTDRHLWAHEYERDLRDVITMQDEVARDIADEVRAKLTPSQRARLAGSHPVNPEAHEAYLKGLYYFNQFTEPNTERSFKFFRQAIQKDPNYALGYSGLADYYAVSYVRFEALSHDDACPKAEAAALKAVELDPLLAEPHRSLGGIRLFCDLDWQGAQSELQRAIQLNPNLAGAHRLYGALLAFRRQSDQAVAQLERAVENDPMSTDMLQSFGWVYYMARDYNRSILEYHKAVDMGPDRPSNHWGLGNVYIQKGQLDLAIREYGKAVELSGKAPWTLAALGYAEALAGRRRQALEILKHLNAASRHRPVSASDRALVYLGLGDKQEALSWIEKAYQGREQEMLSLNVDARFDSLHSDPRFLDLIRRVGF